jgi:hypothetical protein
MAGSVGVGGQAKSPGYPKTTGRREEAKDISGEVEIKLGWIN